MIVDTSTPTAKPAEIYIVSAASPKQLHHIGHAIDDAKQEWKTRCGKTLKSLNTFKYIVPLSGVTLCSRCASLLEHDAFNSYLGECYIIRNRERKAKEKEQRDKTKARQTALRMLAEDFTDILGIYIEEVAGPEHLPGASNIKCKTSIDGHTFEFTIRIPL
jgi:hypothetical protein